MKIISWNVNGIRAARRKNFDSYLHSQNPDLMCIQEAKAKKAVLKEIDYEVKGYHLYWAEGVKPGYSGVAIWVRDGLAVLSCKESIDIKKFDDEGRTLILELEDYFVINSYYPNGREDHSRVDFKLEYSYAVLKIAQELEKKKPVILTGDFNTAHFELDLARPKANVNSTGFLPHEREFLNAMQKSSFVDVFRLKYPLKKDIYSWWSYRGGAKQNNVGWRIDYFWVSQSLAPKIKDIEYHMSENSSDHCPVVLELD